MDPTDLINYANAIKSIESSGNYQALGPATRNGDRAYGAFQVMGNNIPSWTQKHYGQSLSPREFLNNKEAQDAVFNGEFGSYVQKHGNPQDAASMWFTGRPQAQGGNSDDGYITGNEYVDRFNKALGGGGALAAIQNAAHTGGSSMPPGALGFAGTDQEDGGALSKAAAPADSNGGVLFQGEKPNKLYGIGSMLSNIGASIAGINSPSQANSLRSQAKGLEDQMTTGKYTYQMGANGQLVRINKEDGTVDSRAIPDAQKENFTPVMGKDGQGNPVLRGTFDRNTGEYKPVGGTNGQPAQSAYGEALTDENPYGLPQDIEALKTKGAAGQSLYNQLQGIHDGSIQYPTGSRVNKQMEQLRNAANYYFPDLNANDFAARKRYQEENVKQTPGSVGGNKIALNHSYNLIGQISDAMVKLDNSDSGWVPSGVQTMYNNAKNQKPANHAQANTLDTQLMPALAGETGKLYYGQGAGGQAEREKISKGLTSTGTKQDQIAGLETALKTLQAREDDVDNQARQAYGKDWEKYAARNDKGKQDIERIKTNLGILKGELNKDGTPKSIPQKSGTTAATPSAIPSSWDEAQKAGWK